LPTSGGTLFLDEVIFAGSDVSAAQLGDGLFVFQPAVTTTGPADATFKFRVVDSLGGVSDPENQISVHITPIDRILTTYGPGPDSVVGGGGNDTLNGQGGADLMTGWGGNDTYFVDDADDAIIEQPGGGHDAVFAMASYTLPAEVEDLTFEGSGRLNGVGNAADNHITGNGSANKLEGGAGNDTLDGAGGADTLTGGTGDDTYVVDDNRDKVNENANQGIDTVRSWITRTLETNVENLELLGTAAINGTGNSTANMITGNGGANLLSGLGGDDIIGGGAGNDTLVGGAGADLLTGGIGNDVFDYNALSESTDAAPDQITDFIHDRDGDQDLIDLSGIDANTTAPKDQAFMLVAGFSNNPGELMFDSGTLTGDVNGDSAADFTILLAVDGVESTDFIL
jgi:Ca2+-binding RTX toxin-like protein